MLEEDRRAARGALTDQFADLEAVVRVLNAGRDRIRRWTVGKGRPTFRSGMVRVLQRGYDAFVAATANPRPETAHEWRKQAKYLFYQLQFLNSLWHRGAEEIGTGFRELGQVLGDYRDMHLLRQKLAGDPGHFGGDEIVGPATQLIDHQTAELFDRAVGLGRTLYPDGPRQLMKRIPRFSTSRD